MTIQSLKRIIPSNRLLAAWVGDGIYIDISSNILLSPHLKKKYLQQPVVRGEIYLYIFKYIGTSIFKKVIPPATGC